MRPDMCLSISELTFYAFGIFVLFLTPGPVWIAIISRSISSGLKGAAPLAAGVAIGDIIWPSLAIAGSAALDMAYVACGRFDGYWQREINYWDVAAGTVIIKEAGGFVDFFEEEADHPLKKNILATNSNIHVELRDLLNKKDIE